MSANRQLAAIMFADIAGYTALMQKNEQLAIELVHRFKSVLENKAAEYNGRIIQYFGDGCLLAFDSSVNSVNCAIEIQKELRSDIKVPVRIGLHLGDVMFRDGNAFGDGVNVASRIESLSVPGAVLVSKAIRDQVKNNPDFNLKSLGEFHFKNVEEKIEVFGVTNDGLVLPHRNQMQGKLKTGSSKKSILLFSLLGIALIAAAFFLIQSLSRKSNAGSTIDASIAVLPFADLSAARDQEYFSDGLSEELINLLSGLPGLKVIGRTSSFSFKGKNEDLRTIGEKLNVAHILEGSVKRDGEKIRVHAQLVRTSDGFQLWSDKYDRNLKDLFKVQDEIATAVVTQLRLKLLPGSTGGLQSANIEVHNLILQGNYFMQKLDSANVQKALDIYIKAREIDSTDPRVWYRISGAYSRQAWQKYIDQQYGYAKAKEAALKAISLNKDYAGGHLMMALTNLYYEFDWNSAEKNLKIAQRLDPGNPDILNNFCVLSYVQGDWSRALEYIDQALELDPLRLIFYSNKGACLTYSGKYDEALATYKKMVELNPDFQRTHLYTGRLYLLQNKPNDALREMNAEVMPVFKEFGLALAYHALGRKAEADSALQAFITNHSDWPYLVTELYAFRNEKENAIQWLNKAVQANDSWLTWIKGDPLLKNIADHPRYKEVLKNMNLD